MDIDVVVDRLLAVLGSLGVEAPPPPSDPAVLREVESEIAPLRLPLDVVRLVKRLDLRSLQVELHPHACDLAFGLSTWQMHRDEFPGMVPAPLFALCYESHNHLFVELDDPNGQGGGSLFEWIYAGSRFQLGHYSVAAWLDTVATVMEQGGVERVDGPRGQWLRLDHKQYKQLRSTRMEHAPAHPVYGRPILDPLYNHHYGYGIFLEEDVSAWPAHWRRLSGINDDAMLPKGVTHSIAELLREAQELAQREPTGGKLSATIAGEVVAAGGSAAGVQVTVDDGTGQTTIWCPQNVTALGPRMRRRFEFDVLLRWDAAAEQRSQQRVNMRDSSDETERIAARFIGAWGPLADAAIAEAVRPLEHEEPSQ